MSDGDLGGAIAMISGLAIFGFVMFVSGQPVVMALGALSMVASALLCVAFDREFKRTGGRER